MRKKEVASVIAHYIAGVLDRTAMVDTEDSLTQSVSFAPGSRVKTLRGTLHGSSCRFSTTGGLRGERMGLRAS
jgi:hypothetical protein